MLAQYAFLEDDCEQENSNNLFETTNTDECHIMDDEEEETAEIQTIKNSDKTKLNSSEDNVVTKST